MEYVCHTSYMEYVCHTSAYKIHEGVAKVTEIWDFLSIAVARVTCDHGLEL